ncbi:MAG: hypothetical protein HQL69_13425 [Magnetococcales bacterium]|nr:hypothetical protein [Magnetococcales bacterium]
MSNIKRSSDRSFGFVFTVVFGLIAMWPYYDRGDSPHIWAVTVAGLFFLVAIIRPTLLSGLNLLWAKFGMQLNKVTAPIIMGLFFFGVVCPIAFMMRIFGKRPLQLSFDKDATSYWVDREKPGPEPDSMKQQF